MSQDDVFNLLDSIDAGELDTDIEDNFLSDDDLDFVPNAHHFNMENIFDNDADETNEILTAMDETNIEPGTSNSEIQVVKSKEIEIGPSQSKKPQLEQVENDNFVNTFFGSSTEINPKNIAFKNILWRKKIIQLEKKQIQFRGNEELPARFYELKTPYECFKYFLEDKLYQEIANTTNLYACQMNISTKFVTTPAEIQKYVGILFYMSIYRYPNTREYWGENSFEPVRKTMTKNRFEELHRYLHFNDSTKMPAQGDSNFDPIFKMRPIIEYFNICFQSVPMSQRLCVDEQMCSTKMVLHIRQYMPAKPHKWGMKLFVLCDTYGFSYGFELYSGASDSKISNGAPDLGAAANVVSRLSQIIPDHMNHIVYFDNYYSTLPLMIYLYSRGIYSLGTVRANRIANCKLPTDKEVAKKPRGFLTEYVGSRYGVDLSTTLWKDNKGVRLASTYVGVLPFKNESNNTLKASRYDRAQKKRIEIDCPNIIREYNAHMGGVDLTDDLLGRYHIRMKTVKWTSRFFYHVLDLAMINAYLLHKRINRQNKACNIQLPQFRKEVAAMLCRF
ncbi:piggyBac transposable element-derived protein 1-like [Hydra vulgaris]|uniref:piggyBac transposable element-derived protein 1-like n=1 Tax=Hydra vulgaris TaxID=6087 RepID=UPI0032EA5EF9